MMARLKLKNAFLLFNILFPIFALGAGSQDIQGFRFYNTILSNKSSSASMTIDPGSGGLILNDVTASRILTTDGSKVVTPLAAGTSTTVLHGNASGLPTYGAVVLTTDVSGLLPLANGGCNKSVPTTQGGVLYMDSDSCEVTSAGSSGQYLKSTGSSAPAFQSFVAPTVQRFTSGSGTYTTPINPSPLYIVVEIVGGGGGGSGSSDGSFNAGNGGVGSSTSFGTTLLTAGGGGAGSKAASAGATGSGGTGSGIAVANSPAIALALMEGGNGGNGCNNGASSSSTIISCGFGASGFFGGTGGNAAGGNGKVNSGSGGAGAAGNNATNACSGAGGGAGAYVKAQINSPSSTYSYSVGAAGSAGAAGTNGNPGGTGGSGYIVVHEFYQ
jgi:hypothetical protein